MPTTLLTGANSFVGAHVINSLIAAGHNVVGTVRRANVVDEIFAAHPEWKDKLELIVVKDYAEESSWDEVFGKYSFDHVVHVAAPLLDNPANTDYERDYLRPTVDGNLALLRSAHRTAPTLKSIAVTGSVNALTTGSPEELRAGPITNTTWLPITQANARVQNNPYISYCSAKKEGELAIWSFISSTKPAFTTTVLLPSLIFGPPLQPLKSLASLNYSTNVIYSLMNGTYDEIPATTFPSFVDVRDLADAHVKALTARGARDKRLLVDGKEMTYTGLVRALGKVKELEGRLPRESGEDEKVVMARIEAKGDNEVWGIRFRTVEETMRDTAGKLLELERVFGVERA
ncbi:hypothetical protein C8A05DRAFT_47566 [Staphylotrichum tortipilum]|uniref:NAD-dependent epimerase/dehydratase domain-containing protein n=1 Tax=Staphylotrichum tortipilum TaxID=2831512 RepID=A0AAN6RPT2_9PEZI|nr:hypothetical protein C8A05DRAFT_47566 [Staphylotrichum longicolle]